MKTLKLFLTIIVVIFLSVNLFSQTFSTSQGTFKLIPVGDLVDASSVRSAKRVAELAIPAVINESKIIERKRDALQPEIDNYKNDLSRYDADLELYNISLDAYNKNLDAYENELSRYDSELYPHNAAVEAYNSLAEENRSEARYNELMASKNRLDGWLARLDQQKAGLDQSYDRLDRHKADLDYTYENLNSRYEYLQDKLDAIDIEMGKAYRQLEQLVEYAEECNKILKNWNEPILDTYNLNTELEKLKALSNKGWN